MGGVKAAVSRMVPWALSVVLLSLVLLPTTGCISDDGEDAGPASNNNETGSARADDTRGPTGPTRMQASSEEPTLKVEWFNRSVYTDTWFCLPDHPPLDWCDGLGEEPFKDPFTGNPLVRMGNTTTLEPNGSIREAHLNISDIINGAHGELNITVELCSERACEIVAEHETDLESQMILNLTGLQGQEGRYLNITGRFSMYGPEQDAVRVGGGMTYEIHARIVTLVQAGA